MKVNIKDFIEAYIGKDDVGNTPENTGECVGLFGVWSDEWCLKMHVWGHAKDIYYNASETDWFKTPNTPEAYPQAGDVIAWGSAYGPWGHIAVVVDSDPEADTVTVFEQNNWSGDNDGSCELTVYEDWYGIIGWLTPKDIEVIVDDDDSCECCEELKSCEQKLDDIQTILDGVRSSRDGWKAKYETETEKLANEIQTKNEDYERIQKTLAEINQANVNLTKSNADQGKMIVDLKNDLVECKEREVLCQKGIGLLEKDKELLEQLLEAERAKVKTGAQNLGLFEFIRRKLTKK